MFGTLLGFTGDLVSLFDTVARFRALAYPRLCVVGSSTLLGDELALAINWERDFERVQQVRLVVEPIGSEAGVRRAASGGCAHVLAMSEPLAQDDLDELNRAGVEIACAAEIAYDPIIFVTDFNNEVPPLSLEQIGAILNGQVTNWSQLGGQARPIHILYNPDGGTTHYVLARLGGITALEQLPEQASYIPCHSTADCLEQTLATPGSFYWASAAWLHDQPAYFRVYAIRNAEGSPVEPYSELVELKDYPPVLIRPLYLYALEQKKSAARIRLLGRAFIEYARSAQAQQWVEDEKFFSYFWRPQGVEVPLPPGFEPQAEGRRQVCRSIP
jgi:phosphate transport system substrate-binding protein